MLAVIPPQNLPTGCDPSSGNLDLGSCLTLDGSRQASLVYGTPAQLINVIVRNVFVIAGLFFFFVIFYAGWKFIQSGAKGKEDAKTMIKTALIGFIVMFAAYWIVQVVEIIVGQQIIF